jgi:tetratricopeptide (TPR) repeat protein
MSRPTSEIVPENVLPWWESACQYDKIGDVYHAVKLFRRIIRENPVWVPPYIRLIHIYLQREEWKQVYAFSKRALSLDASLKAVWWYWGVSAEKTGKLTVAKRVWSKFGLLEKIKIKELVCLKISYDQRSELIWALTCGPAKAQIINIPYPTSGFCHQDIVYYHRISSEYQVVGKIKHPIYHILSMQKPSHFNTYSCMLKDTGEEDLKKLGDLCQQAGLGFEIWSNSTRALGSIDREESKEYYFIHNDLAEDEFLISMAARREDQVKEILNAWEIITLKIYTDFKSYEKKGNPISKK